jgi:saccharopine dehydrogenase-like NADP-dependent oxidoreductase
MAGSGPLFLQERGRAMGDRKRIVVAGSGRIGRAVGLLLREIKSEVEVDLYFGDLHLAAAESAAAWVQSKRPGAIEPFTLPAEGFDTACETVFRAGDLLLDCLPGSQAPRFARAALENGMHYVNITEYVRETAEIVELAQGADTGFLLQTGLAPGFINVLGLQLLRRFQRRFGVENIDRLAMRVGALTQSVVAPHFYGFTWSPIGVATEYVKPTHVVRDHQTMECPALSERATVIVDGLTLEEDFTSGGVADLCEALAPTVRHLDYKTLRYPGHFAWVDGVLDSLPEGVQKSKALDQAMQSAIPLMYDDVVIIHAYAEGVGSNGHRHQLARSFRIEPEEIGPQRLTAIQSTTAAGMAESAYMLLTGDHKGPVLQSQIDPEEFMAGPFVSHVYGTKPAA